MGIAIISGVLTSLDSRQASSSKLPNGFEPPSGVSTPTGSMFLDAPEEALPSRFIATVGREETGRKLRKALGEVKGGTAVEVHAGEGNVRAVREADVILVW